MTAFGDEAHESQGYEDGSAVLTSAEFSNIDIIHGLDPAKPLAVAVSGGPDSMALCYLLSQWVGRNGTQIHAITVDHGLRPEAEKEAEQVGAWLADWPHIRHVILKRPPVETDSRIMEDARNDRYAMMAEYCAHHGIENLLVAHHRDDQAETFLFRLAKGSGLDGLSCMRAAQPYNDELTILRPLLAYSKADLVAVCADHALPYVEDPSNRNADYARPRLRKTAAALSEEGLTPKRLSVTAARMTRAREALEMITEDIFARAVQQSDMDKMALDYDFLMTQPAEIRLRVVLKLIDTLGPQRPYAPRMEKCEDLEHRIFGPRPFKAATLGGVIFRRDKAENSLLAEKETAA